MQQYYSFTDKGQTDLPLGDNLDDKQDILEPILFLDSCVCLDIVKVVDYKKKANVNINKVVNLKKYISQTGNRIRPMFGLLELCYNNGSFNDKKFWDFRNRIDYFEQIPLKHFLKFKYDFNIEFFLLKKPQINAIETIKSLEYLFLNSYSSLLKIRTISQNGLTKDKAEKNLNEFFQWMVNDLGIILGIEYNLALNIFGGSNDFRKMIWLDGKHKDLRKKLIGSAWDIFHSRLSTNNYDLINLLDNVNITGYFITNDNALFKLFAEYGITGIIEKSKDLGTLKIFNTAFNAPHFDSDFIEKQNRLMIEELTNKFNKPSKNTVEKTRQIINDLETTTN